MKLTRFFKFCILQSVFISAAHSSLAQKCTPENCKRENGCACSSSSSPIPLENTPQFVTLTFDDSISSANYIQYYSRLLFNRTNADGSPIGATFYVPHSYTDYERVNNLFKRGYEIGVNSISKGTADYFRDASVEQLVDEFAGQRIIVSTFANISIDYIKGARTPHFQLSGNKIFEAYAKAGLEYDNSWVALNAQPIYPYTLDYKSNQQCNVGTCPNASFPGIWVLPVTNHLSKYNTDCNVLFSCGLNSTSLEITNWLIDQFQNARDFTRKPLNFLLNSAWFEIESNSFEGFEGFLDYLENLNDTFVVSHGELVNWSKNPIPLEDYKPTVLRQDADCTTPITCPLQFGEHEIRYMRSCVPCPDVYPWLKNPTGEDPINP